MSFVRNHVAAAGLLVALCAAGTAAAVDSESAPSPETLSNALASGEFAIDLRYRLESVDDEAFEKDALASTLRAALTYETGSYRGFFAGVTFETVTAIGNDELYNNLGAGSLNNGVTDRPVVADPEIIEVDRIFLAYRGAHGLQIRAGRFGYTLDNQRFVGTAPWRQNERSYEGLSFAIGAPTSILATYAYMARVYYNNGASPGLDAHLFNFSRTLGPGALSAYAYLLDWDNIDRDSLSSATYGLRFHGETTTSSIGLLYFAEYARQNDYGDNPRDFSLDYAHLGLGARRGAWQLQAGWELKDGDGTSAVQTPLGTNHGKNGFADRLVITPPEGSQDLYIRLSMDRERWAWAVAYHDFQAALGDDRLGTEIDFVARYTPVDPLSIFLKVADYTADTLSTDVTKVMLWAAWRFDTEF
jgi:hypothetical protein